MLLPWLLFFSTLSCARFRSGLGLSPLRPACGHSVIALPRALKSEYSIGPDTAVVSSSSFAHGGSSTAEAVPAHITRNAPRANSGRSTARLLFTSPPSILRPNPLRPHARGTIAPNLDSAITEERRAGAAPDGGR